MPLTDIQINIKGIEFEEATILLADDIESNRKFIIDALKTTKIKLTEAENGHIAYQIAQELIPDLILTDIRMPEMNGFELLDRLKQDKKLEHIPVIAYSASVMKDQKDKIYNSKFAGLLIKPVLVTELFTELMKHIPYKLTKSREQEPQEHDINLLKQINDLPGLINSLETTFMDTWKTFATRQPMDEIEKFGKEMIGLGKEHDAILITEFGEELVNARDSFNIKTILKLLKRYTCVIDELKDSTQKFFV
jgi:CheY-like chemotaxis protein